jgi:Cu2+-exporting ATPase
MGLRVVMLTGDNRRTAEAIGAQAGVDTVVAGVLPDGKERVIRELRGSGKVVMVGDGINDAPALTGADVGIAIGAGTDIAIDAADVVLMKSSLSDVPAAIRLSRAVLRNIHENLFWAFIYNVIGIPLAAGAFISLFGWTLNPMFGAAAMSLSSFCVVSNALRLNWFRLRDGTKGKGGKTQAPLPDLSMFAPEEEKTADRKTEWTRRLQIEGMMCEHCEATVKKALESIEGIISAEADHRSGIAVVKGTGRVPEDRMRQAVEAEDYTVRSVE